MIFEPADLTPPEQTVWDSIATGQVVRLQSANREHNNPATGATWGRERSIRGQLLAQLLAEGGNSATPPARFLRLQGARITGGLNLEVMTLRCPVTLRDCYFDEAVLLNEAQVISLRLHGCHLPGLTAERIETRHNLELSRGFTARGEVNVLGAHIRGRLELNRATLQNPGGPALRGEGLTVDQDLFCEDLQADGEVRLEGARIGGTLNFNSACLYNPDGRALTADGITVAQPLYCGRGFQADGEVRLVGAHINGILALNQARLRNPGGVALAADYLSVDHDMLCNDRFRADGMVSLRDTRLGGLSDSKETWPRQLLLDGLTYDHLTAYPEVSAKERLGWLRNDLDRYVPQPYEQLAAVYRKAGREQDARRVAIAKQRRRRKELSLSGRFVGLLFDAFVAYGYRTRQAVLWLAALVVLGHLAFSSAYHKGLLIPAKDKAQPSFHSVWYTVDVLLPIVSLGQESAWTTYGCAMHWTNAFILAGWVLTTAVVAAVTGAFRRD